MNSGAMGMGVPMMYVQQQSPPVTSLGLAFQHGLPPASKGTDKVLVSFVFNMNILWLWNLRTVKYADYDLIQTSSFLPKDVVIRSWMPVVHMNLHAKASQMKY